MPVRHSLPVVFTALIGALALLFLLAACGEESVTTVPTTVSNTTATTTTTGTGDVSGSEEDRARLAEADTLLWKGRLLEAADSYSAILQSNPSFGLAHRQLGIAYFMMTANQYQAEIELRTAAEALPADATTAAFLGQSIYLQQRSQHLLSFDEAEEWLRKAVQLDGRSALPHAFLAEVLAAAGRTQEAQTEAEKAVAMDPDSSWAQYALGIAHAFADEWEQATGPYQKAVLLNPSWPHLYPALIEALRHMGDYDEALAYCSTLEDLGQGYEAEALSDQGFTLDAAGDKEGAIEAFYASLAIDDTDDYTQWGLGSILYEQGDYEGALPHLHRAADLAPAEPAYHAWEASCLLELKRYDEAREAAQRALELDPLNEDAQWVLEEVAARGPRAGSPAVARPEAA